MGCEHHNFAATVNVGRLTNEAGKVTSYLAEVTVKCAECGLPFQFLGLPTGMKTNGAAVSPHALECRLGLCPEGTHPSMLSHVAAMFAPPAKDRH